MCVCVCVEMDGKWCVPGIVIGHESLFGRRYFSFDFISLLHSLKTFWAKLLLYDDVLWHVLYHEFLSGKNKITIRLND